MFSRLNGFTLVILGALYSLLFGESRCSVLKTVIWPSIIVYFFKLWLGWRVVLLALIPHLLIYLLGFFFRMYIQTSLCCRRWKRCHGNFRHCWSSKWTVCFFSDLMTSERKQTVLLYSRQRVERFKHYKTYRTKSKRSISILFDESMVVNVTAKSYGMKCHDWLNETKIEASR